MLLLLLLLTDVMLNNCRGNHQLLLRVEGSGNVAEIISSLNVPRSGTEVTRYGPGIGFIQGDIRASCRFQVGSMSSWYWWRMSTYDSDTSLGVVMFNTVLLAATSGSGLALWWSHILGDLVVYFTEMHGSAQANSSVPAYYSETHSSFLSIAVIEAQLMRGILSATQAERRCTASTTY